MACGKTEVGKRSEETGAPATQFGEAADAVVSCGASSARMASWDVNATARDTVVVDLSSEGIGCLSHPGDLGTEAKLHRDLRLQKPSADAPLVVGEVGANVQSLPAENASQKGAVAFQDVIRQPTPDAQSF